MRLLRALILLLLASGHSASAQGTEECRSIPDRTARLACYDREAPPLSSSRAPAAPPARTATPSPMSDSPRYTESPGSDDELLRARMNSICRGC